MATLTDQQSGQQTLYYNRDCGYDPANPEAAYFNALNLVCQYANGSAICHLETGEELEEDEYLQYIYEKLTELGDYKQAKEFLARFTVVPSKLTEQTLYATDSQGNSHSNHCNHRADKYSFCFITHSSPL